MSPVAPEMLGDGAAGSPLEELERRVHAIKPGQMSRDGNAYTALSLSGVLRAYMR